MADFDFESIGFVEAPAAAGPTTDPFDALGFQELDPSTNQLGTKSKPVLGEAPKSKFQKGIAGVKRGFSKGGGGRAFVDPFIGAGKSFIRGTGATAASIGERGIRGLGRVLTPKRFEERLGLAKDRQTAGQQVRESERFQPTSGFQELGGLAEQIGEFAIPVGKVAKAGQAVKGAKALQAAEGAGLVQRGAKGLARGLALPAAEGLAAGGVTAIQEGEVGEEALKGAAFGAALPGVAKVGQVTKKFLGKALPEAFTKAALNLTKNQKVAIKNITSGGDTAESFLLRNQIGGEPAEISRQLLNKSKEIRKTKLDTLSGLSGKLKNKQAEEISKSLLKELDGVPGLEKELARIDEIATAVRGDGATLAQLDELKTLADQFVSPFTAAGSVKEAAKAKGMASLRKGLKEFIEVEADKLGAGNIKALNNEISLTRKIGDAIRKQDVGAGGNAVAKLSDLIVGGSVFGGAGGIASGDIEGALKGAILGTGAALTRRAFTPSMKIKVANSLSKVFNKGEAGAILNFLQGTSKKPLKPAQKQKLKKVLVDSGVAKQLTRTEQKLLPQGAIPLPSAKPKITNNLSSSKMNLKNNATKFKDRFEFIEKDPEAYVLNIKSKIKEGKKTGEPFAVLEHPSRSIEMAIERGPKGGYIVEEISISKKSFGKPKTKKSLKDDDALQKWALQRQKFGWNHKEISKELDKIFSGS